MQEPIKTSSGITQNLAGMLCYLGWWITGLIFFLVEKENRFVRFHAMQSLITFGGLAILQFLLSMIPFLGWAVLAVVWIAGIVLWIVLMVKAYQGEMFKLPVIGDIAEKNI